MHVLMQSSLGFPKYRSSPSAECTVFSHSGSWIRVGPLTIFSVWSALLLSKKKLPMEHQTQSLALSRPSLTTFPSPAPQSRTHVITFMSLHSSSEKHLTHMYSSRDRTSPHAGWKASHWPLSQYFLSTCPWIWKRVWGAAGWGWSEMEECL